ncbi:MULTISPECIES: Hsp20 family protein [unclassified Clostridium]|jgi:HSP20 family protein|uniref:Hsp20 family protein n=1 Tax=unclassified Clostridium TaxID=2614128 RepID=UPI001C8B61AE|nr:MULTISPECIES: Hsp20 family protein [unclassified Clostridium]MBX9138667.1 Hsp20 family protein [Clostridium sp. K12(2020)]MBX9145398.1 Hsp20 family protein [Clostridium sp. K13]MDU2291787.1 Hsp20 family protein [Clostridium celatum]MDU4325719.1 Hsp20 family protein [Clostridium celatum]
MFNIFPYIFSTTLNAVTSNIGLIDKIVDNVINSDFMNNLINEIDSMSSVNINFKEHKRAYTLECYLPGVKKENIDLEYENNYITLKVKRNMFYTNNQNIAMAVIQSGGDIEEDYYVENADAYNIKAVFKDDTLRVLIPKNTYIGTDTTIIDVDNYEAKI